MTAPRSALHHVSLGVADVEAARALYAAMLAPLGMRELYVVEFGEGPVAVAFGIDLPEFWIQRPHDRGEASAGNGVHVALRASDHAAVDAFHAAALAAGATSDGEPGPRPHYTPDYYAAFVRDRDGNKVEAVFMESMDESGP